MILHRVETRDHADRDFVACKRERRTRTRAGLRRSERQRRGIDAVRDDAQLGGRKPARHGIAAAGFGIGDDEIRHVGKTPLDRHGEADQRAVGGIIEIGRAHAPHQPVRGQKPAQTSGGQIGRREERIDDIGTQIDQA